MHIGWPQGTMLGLLAFSLLIAALLDGTPKKGEYSLSVRMLDVAITLGVLCWGGFFA